VDALLAAALAMLMASQPQFCRGIHCLDSEAMTLPPGRRLYTGHWTQDTPPKISFKFQRKMWLVEEDWPAERYQERYQDHGLTLHIELRIKGDPVVRVHAADHMPSSPSRRVPGALRKRSSRKHTRMTLVTQAMHNA
jgi:hypothetical protein